MSHAEAVAAVAFCWGAAAPGCGGGGGDVDEVVVGLSVFAVAFAAFAAACLAFLAAFRFVLSTEAGSEFPGRAAFAAWSCCC